MGACFKFACPQCGYQAEVSGGDDSGLEDLTTTIVCIDCRQLHDVTIAKRGDEETLRPPVCPKSARHVVKSWIRGGPCPRCNAPMIDQGLAFLWD